MPAILSPASSSSLAGGNNNKENNVSSGGIGNGKTTKSHNNNNNGTNSSSTAIASALSPAGGPKSSVNAVSNGPRSGSFREVDALHTGTVVLGRANLDNLEVSAGVRQQAGRGAEGGVFDPALIYLLAKSYSLAHSLHGSEEATTRLREGSYSISNSSSVTSVVADSSCVGASSSSLSSVFEQQQKRLQQHDQSHAEFKTN